MRVAIIGKGRVGTALATGLKGKGHEIRFGHRDPAEPVNAAAKWGEVIILAVPHEAVTDVAKTIGSAADGKPLIDVTNALDQNMNLTVGFTTSFAEEVQKMLPKAHVVKAFNTMFAQNQSTGRIGKEQLTAFIAGDNTEAKQTVMKLAADIGFDAVDSGALKAARYLEPMGSLVISLGFSMRMVGNVGFRLVKGSR